MPAWSRGIGPHSGHGPQVTPTLSQPRSLVRLLMTLFKFCTPALLRQTFFAMGERPSARIATDLSPSLPLQRGDPDKDMDMSGAGKSEHPRTVRAANLRFAGIALVRQALTERSRFFPQVPTI